MWTKLLLPGALLAVGLVMIAVGVAGGEVLTVFAKAARVCLECIGIG
ncbi:MAG: CD1871A family CXXC motif-containing protein [Christensenellales bacterium]